MGRIQGYFGFDEYRQAIRTKPPAPFEICGAAFDNIEKPFRCANSGSSPELTGTTALRRNPG